MYVEVLSPGSDSLNNRPTSKNPPVGAVFSLSCHPLISKTPFCFSTEVYDVCVFIIFFFLHSSEFSPSRQFFDHFFSFQISTPLVVRTRVECRYFFK